ncbi:MAG: ABC transporter permease [Chloroflexota bacterium]|jgi:peptide/nickel transport system permease protein
MIRYLLRRAGQAVVVLVGAAVLVFALLQIVPGDPIRSAMGTRFDPEVYAELRAASGLDLPLHEQLVRYLSRAAVGDFGVSFRNGESVFEIVVERLPATISLGVAALVVALLISFPLGILSAIRRGSAIDHFARLGSQIGISVPDFWLAILLILLLTATLHLLPPSGYVPLTEDPLEWLRHVIMPALTVGLISGSIMTRFIRSATLESNSQDFARTARAKGLHESVVLRDHVLRNAMVPIVTVAGIQLASLLAGVIVVEVVFAWPGLGRLTYDAVLARDYTVVQGAVLLVAAIFLLANLVVDALYAIIDPRIRVQ